MAQAKKVGNVMVNDGKGLLDNEGLIDSLIMDCNNSVKQLIDGSYAGWCQTIVYMIQKLSNLKKGMKNEIQARDEEIEMLKKELNDIGEKMFARGDSKAHSDAPACE